MNLLTAEQSLKIAKARTLAIRKHKNRYGSRPFVYHLDAVNFIAHTFELDFNIQVASFLHDLIEDTEVTYSQLALNFGHVIADIVYDVTDELGRTRSEAKMKTYQKTKQSQAAILLKICDRIANIEHSINEHSWSKLRMYLDESVIFRNEIINNLKSQFDSKNRSILSYHENVLVSANVIFKKHESNTISIKQSNWLRSK